MDGFEKHQAELQEIGVSVLAASTDNLQNAEKVAQGKSFQFGHGVSRAFQATGMGMELTHRTLWCVNEKVIEGQVTIALQSGNNIEDMKHSYAGGYDAAQAHEDRIRGM